jgi:hypothetical protein
MQIVKRLQRESSTKLHSLIASPMSASICLVSERALSSSSMSKSNPGASLEAKPRDGEESTDGIELRPDSEERFRKAVHAAAKAGPMHKVAKR